MKITELQIENFLAISEATVRLDDRGLVLIQGDNRDDSSAVSNGAGKSTIPDALDWVLFGETARGEKGDAVVNNAVGKGTRVSAYIVDGDESYLIQRHRKHKTGKNALHVRRIMPKLADLTKGTDKLTQEVVNQIVGCSHEVFRAAVYAGQEQMPDLPAMTDKQLKELIEEAAGITLLERAYDIARERHTAQKRQVEATERELELVGIELRGVQTQLADAKESHLRWQGERKARCEELVIEAKEYLRQHKQHATALEETDSRETMTARVTELQAQLDAVAGEKVRLDELRLEEMKAQRAFERAKASYDAKYREVVKARDQYDHVEDHVGKPCGECGKLYKTADLAEAKRLAGERVRALVAEAKSLKIASDDALQSVQNASQKRADYERAMTDVSATSRALRVAESNLEQRDHLEHARDQAKLNADRRVEKLKVEKAAVNPYDAKIEELRQRREELDAKETKIADRLIEAQRLLAVAREAAKVYSPAGVRAHILDTVTPFLNERTAQYLGALSDGNLSANWSTISLTAKGEARERFAIDVVSLRDAKTFKGLSGGQKRKVRLACAMALQDLVASRATKPISLWCGDEIDDALDTAGLERLMTILDSKARERGTVLVISHSDLRDWIGQVITVVREGGVSFIADGVSAGLEKAA